ncbi:MAG: hypothetical protein ACT4NX_07160 [Deltaproteobacteria bacterium]
MRKINYSAILIVLSVWWLASGLPSAAEPFYAEVGFTDLSGEILINPWHTGKVNAVKIFRGEGFDKKAKIKITEVDGWQKLIVPALGSGDAALIASGKNGSVRISRVKEKTPAQAGKLQPVGEPEIIFGELNATFLLPKTEISEPGSFRIGIFDVKRNKFVAGDVIALKNNQIAVKFYNLSPDVVNAEGLARVSLKKPDGGFLNTNLKTWGYNIQVGDVGTGKPATITAEVFGLPKEATLEFGFEPLRGQKIYPSAKTLTAGEINSGKPLGTIVTEIPGEQPISVKVRRVN